MKLIWVQTGWNIVFVFGVWQNRKYLGERGA